MKTLTTLFLFALAASPAVYAGDWNAEQSAVWAVVAASWEDEAAGNGKWPGDYVHADVVSWGENWPVPRNGKSMVKWSRYGEKNGKIVIYELFPQNITVVGDTAVVNYSTVIVNEDREKKRKRAAGGQIETLVRDGETWKFLALTGFEKGDD